MENINTIPENLLERFNRWIQESIMVKLFSIGFLILLLLIPTAWIEDLIYERQQRADAVIDEVADKWSDAQKISGPVLVVPYRKQEIIDLGKGVKEIRQTIDKAFFLPETLDVVADVSPEILHRGIFDAVVYQSSIKVNASFASPDFQALQIPESNVLWNEAHMIFGMTDLRGISDTPTFLSGDKNLIAEPSNNIGIRTRTMEDKAVYATYHSEDNAPNLTGTGVITKLKWENAEGFVPTFSINMKLKGSRRLDFVPTGKTTVVKLAGKWNNPSFDGEFLPAEREVSDSAFSAMWKVLHFNRPFSQHWVGANQELSGADFGVKLLIPVDQYQKSIRTSKYAVLIILLTFMALFLVEITQKIRIHPFQYILIGGALIIYYTLLLSLSEHIGYDLAYFAAALATVGLISWYSTTFFTSNRLAILFCILLVVFYGFIYVIILQQDFSLLLGSIGLFLIIGTVMYFSRTVRWYRDQTVRS